MEREQWNLTVEAQQQMLKKWLGNNRSHDKQGHIAEEVSILKLKAACEQSKSNLCVDKRKIVLAL